MPNAKQAVTMQALAAVLLAAAPISAQAADDGAVVAALFDPLVMHEVRVEMHSQDWDRLRQNYMSDTYYPADVAWDGHVIRNAGVRSRGFGSRDFRKPGLKIDFNEYVSGGQFAGLKGFVLDNFRQDPSMMREALTMQLFARMGLPAPRVAHARVQVNGEYVGLFAVIELVDKPFLASRFGDDEGYLYDFEWDSDYRFTWLGDDPRRYAAMFKAETHEQQPPHQLHGTLVEMVTAINRTTRTAWPAVLERYFDVEALMAYLAVEAYLADHDGLAGDWGINNFYLHRRADSERFQFIPWDKDVNFREPERDVLAGMEGNALLQTAMEYPRFRDAYHQALRRCVQIASQIAPGHGNGWLELEVIRTAELIREAARADPNKAYDDERFEQEVAWLFDFARIRTGQVLRQVGAR